MSWGVCRQIIGMFKSAELSIDFPGLFQDFPRTFSGLSQDFLRTFPGLSHDVLVNFSVLSQDFHMTFPGLYHDFKGISQDFLRKLS